MYKLESNGNKDALKQVSVCTSFIALLGRMT